MTRADELKAQLREELREVEQYAGRLRKALAALEPEAPKAERPPKPKPKPKGRRDSHDWTPSEEVLHAVIQALGSKAGPMSVTEVADLVGKSKTTVTNALATLREREEVRYVGTEKRGPVQTKVYMLMRVDPGLAGVTLGVNGAH